MIINRKRNGGMEIDYLVFSFFRYKIWITRSKYFCKYPRIVIWKMSKNQNVGAEKTWSYKFG
jgi:hypothetical protein